MGNWLYKEWSQLDSDDEFTNPPQKTKTKSKKESLNVNKSASVVNPPELTPQNSAKKSSTPVSNKVVLADYDPRSPSNGIPRTPICYLNEEKSKRKAAMPEMIDPRSPTNEYNRTPIHCNKQKNPNQNDGLNSSLFNESTNTLDNSSSFLGSADNSLLLQQVPDNLIASNSSYNESPNKEKMTGAKVKHSNNPSHILQRKQVQKLNKNKLIIDQEKENEF